MDANEGPIQKKLKYDGDAGDEAPLDEGVKNILSTVEATQSKIDKLNDESAEEILKIERKYQTLRRPLYNDRNEKLRQIPNFWGTAIQNHPIISNIIMERDSEVLDYVTDLDVADFEDLKKGFSIKLVFAPNPFFKNTELVKRMSFEPEKGVIRTECTPVEWVSPDGADTVFTEDNSGFMNWFLTNEDIDNSVEEVAAEIRDSLFVEPVQFFKGEVPLMIDGEDDSVEDDGEEEEEEEGSGEDDEEKEG